MNSKREAILVGANAAGKLHEQLRIQEQITQTLSSVDVYLAISELEIILLFKDLKGPLGVALPGPQPGILINRGRPPMMQRFTAAHELGHIFMGHSGSIDHQVFEGVDAIDNSRPLEEIAADAFASEFLLPKWLLILHTRKHNWASKEALSDPAIVYQLSLRVGVSFEAMGWSLKAQNILSDRHFNAIRNTTPKQHKTRLLGKHVLPNSWNDVWHLTPKDDGLSYSIRQGDYIVVELPSITTSGYIWEINNSETNSIFEIIEDQHIDITPIDQIGGTVNRRVVLFMKESGQFSLSLEEKRPWKKDGSVRSSFRSNLTILKPEQGGLPNSTRLRLAS